MPTIDFSKVQDSFEPIPEGTYEGVLTEWEQRTSKNGDPYIACTFTMAGDYEGRKVWHNFSLLPQSLWALKSALVAMGVDRNELAGEIDIEEVLSGCIGNPVSLELEIREWNGKFNNSVKKLVAA